MSIKSKEKIAICTIVAKNYLALAKTLGDSLHHFHPDYDFYIHIVDRAGFPRSQIDNDSIYLVDPLEIMDVTQYNEMAGRYDITEFSTSVKPFMLEHLLNKGYEKVFYFDPDILILNSLEKIVTELDGNNVVLTPHLLDPIPLDGYIPNEASILKAGTYNLGFIGISNSAETYKFLDWWQQRMVTMCVDAQHLGLFVDQKWINLVPSIFKQVRILKYPGFNVAYWNIHSRYLTEIDGKYFVGDEKVPLVFFHFSGLNYEDDSQFSKHQDRVKIEEVPVLVKLVHHYKKLIKENGHNLYKSLPYTPGVPDGVNVVGYFTSHRGTGVAAKGYVQALKLLNIGLFEHNFTQVGSRRIKEDKSKSLAKDNPFDINLICVNADQVEKFLAFSKYNFLEKKTNIGVWWWELPNFPDIWKNRFSYFDQIWVGSEFAREAIQAATNIPVIKIPPVVEYKCNSQFNKNYYGLHGDEFIFLFVFDFASVFERKNPIGLVHAFIKAFAEDKNTILVLKCVNDEEDPENMLRLMEEIKDSRIKLMSNSMSKDELAGLYSVCDCYISLHRSEGFGYTMAEAMLLGKPVIATAWSGNMDFMNSDNSYLVNYNLVDISDDYGPYKKGQTWAQPDEGHAAEMMRHVYENKDDAIKKGEIARNFIETNHSREAVAAQIMQRLYELPKKTKFKKRSYFKRIMYSIFTSSPIRKLMYQISLLVPIRFSKVVKSTLVRLGWY